MSQAEESDQGTGDPAVRRKVAIMLTVGIGNSVFHTMCVIIATLFSNCILCKYCTFLFIIILVHVRYVFIKKSWITVPGL